MKRTRPIVLMFAAVLALLIQTLAIPGAAAGLVTCFGSDGHVATEQAITSSTQGGGAFVDGNGHHWEPCTDVAVSRSTIPGLTERSPSLTAITAIVILVWAAPVLAIAPEIVPVLANDRGGSASREFTETIRLTI